MAKEEVAVYNTHCEGEQAVKTLLKGGFDVKKLSIQYETALKADKFLLIAHGTPGEVGRAKSIIDGTRPAEEAVHHG